MNVVSRMSTNQCDGGMEDVYHRDMRVVRKVHQSMLVVRKEHHRDEYKVRW